jgi:O-antigen ligase
MNIKYKFSIVVLAFLLATPLTLYSYETTGVVPADFVSAFGFVIFLAQTRTREGVILLVAIFCALISWAQSAYVFSEASLYTLGSLVFLFKPCFTYFAALYFIKDRGDINRFFNWFGFFVFFVFAGFLYSVVFNFGGVFRSESELQVDLYGFAVFGFYGVNSLAAYIAMCTFFSIFALRFKGDLVPRVSMAFIVFCGIFLTISSLSREAIVGLFVMFLSYAIFNKFGLRFLFAVALAFVVVLPVIFDSQIFEAKVVQVLDGFDSGDFDKISSGRLSLYMAAFQDFYDNPLRGTGFRGFSRNNILLDQFDDVAGLSPHNTYITPFWKGGVFVGLFYIWFLISIVFKSIDCSTLPQRRWLISFYMGFLIFMGNLWDVLIIPNVGAIFFFLCGMFCRINIGAKNK